MGKDKRRLVQWQSKKAEDICNEDGESYLANPDMLVEQPSALSSPQQLMGEAIEHLQGRQREVYILVMREDKSMAEAGEILNISKSSIQVYLDRAVIFITDYCRQAIDGGRV